MYSQCVLYDVVNERHIVHTPKREGVLWIWNPKDGFVYCVADSTSDRYYDIMCVFRVKCWHPPVSDVSTVDPEDILCSLASTPFDYIRNFVDLKLTDKYPAGLWDRLLLYTSATKYYKVLPWLELHKCIESNK